jgi:hypothetical protein
MQTKEGTEPQQEGPGDHVSGVRSTARPPRPSASELENRMLRDGIALPVGQTLTACPPPRSRLGYTVAEVAAIISKHPNTVYLWIRRGELKARRIGNAFYTSPRALALLLDEELAS